MRGGGRALGIQEDLAVCLIANGLGLSERTPDCETINTNDDADIIKIQFEGKRLERLNLWTFSYKMQSESLGWYQLGVKHYAGFAFCFALQDDKCACPWISLFFPSWNWENSPGPLLQLIHASLDLLAQRMPQRPAQPSRNLSAPTCRDLLRSPALPPIPADSCRKPRYFSSFIPHQPPKTMAAYSHFPY